MGKRLFDLGLAILLLPVAVLLCLPAACLIRLETPGNPLFLQRRVGRYKTPFFLWKLRSMKVGTKEVGTHEVASHAVTRVGYVIRKVKLDELPQIWNVLRGDMSFVGPRPCLPNQTELIMERDARGVFEARPGITGLAQARRINMSTPRLLAQTDAEYLSSYTLITDLKLIGRTLVGHGHADAIKSKDS